jgi:hypothetical protein
MTENALTILFLVSGPSWAADALIRILYFPTPPQPSDYRFEIQILFIGSFFECCQIFGVFGEGQLNGFVDRFGNGLVRCRSLEPEGTMDLWIEIDGGSLCCVHGTILTL